MDTRIKQIIHALASVRNLENKPMVNEAIYNCRLLDIDYKEIDEQRQKESFYNKIDRHGLSDHVKK
jgi:hypothetical protein